VVDGFDADVGVAGRGEEFDVVGQHGREQRAGQ
jgi:hypothetical protein